LAGVLENCQESTDCTRGVTQRLLGLQNCSKISYTNASTVADAPSFPLTGPANLNLYLEKDGAVKAYRFLHQVENSQVRVRKMESAGSTLNNFSYSLTSLQRKKSWNLTFRTESERDTKEVGVKAEVDLENSQLGLDLLFPQTNYNMKGLQLLSISGEFQFIGNERNVGTFKWTDPAKEVEATFMKETTKVFSAKTSLVRATRNKQQVLQPKFLLTYNNQNYANLNGLFNFRAQLDPTKRSSANVK